MNSSGPKAQGPEPRAGRKAEAQRVRIEVAQGFRLWAGSGLWALGFGLVLACYPTTTRPAFLPEPMAAAAEVELAIPQATRALAVALDADSIPVRRTEAKDGWLESDWFDASTLQPTTRRRLGPDVVKVRAWVDPSRPNHSNITVETVYRPLADPSRPDRDLEEQVPVNHPVGVRILLVLGKLSREHGGVEADTSATTDSIPPRTPATTISKPRPDSIPAKSADSIPKKPVKPPLRKP